MRISEQLFASLGTPDIWKSEFVDRLFFVLQNNQAIRFF